METLIKLLLKDNKQKLLKQLAYKQQWQKMKQVIPSSFFNTKIRTDFDYYTLEVIYQGILNKQTLQNRYEKTREQLYDLWDVLDNKERLLFINKDLNKIKPNLISFQFQDTTIWIPFFDTLLNNLYDHSMTVFELKQYHNLYESYKDRIIPIRFYGCTPFKAGFSKAQYLCGDDDCFVLYNPDINCMYRIQSYQEQLRLPLSLQLDNNQLQAVAQHLLTDNVNALYEFFIEHELCSPKVLKKIIKHYRK